jgi:thymidylate kinase
VTPREQLLLELFRRLEDQQVRYCVLRNFQGLFHNPDSDVDLLVEPADLARAFDCLAAASTATNHQIILQNRFVNYSYVLWDGVDHLIRIDLQTEERWRIFEVLSAKEILDARCRESSFFVPHSNHRCVILLLTAAWKNELQDRYADRLIGLVAECQNIAALQAVLERALGRASLLLVDRDYLNRTAATIWVPKLRRSVIRKTLLTPSRALRSFRHLLTDTGRLLGRLRRPPGVILKIFAPPGVLPHIHNALYGLEFLYAMKQTRMQTGSDARRRLPWGTWWRNIVESQRCLIRCGIYLQICPVPSDVELSALMAQHCGSGHWHPERTLICIVDDSGHGQLAHVGSGLMIQLDPTENRAGEEFTPRVVRFACSMLNRPHASHVASRQGLFCVVVGLDGSGKTTLARNLAIASTSDAHQQFRGVRYYHWLPRLWKPVEWPYSMYEEYPRSRNYPASPLHVGLSCVRLLRSLLWAHLAYALVVRQWRRRNYLVLLDRYIYNYILDPSSVKYSGPRWLLNGVLPLFPRPDAVILLRADPSVLQPRKRELSPDEFAAQTARLDVMKVYAPRCIALDASLPADQVASAAFASILETVSDHGAT